jgi:competence protein ComEC
LLLTSDIAIDRRPKWVWRGLTASTAAQISVLPLLLVYFDTVPLLAPLAHVVAAPLVAASTILAGVGVVAGLSFVVDGGVAVAGLVLEVARVAATGPQLGPSGVIVALGVGTLTVFRSTRILGASLAVSALLLGSGSSPAVLPDSVTVLDVGQGDAVLITGSDGSVVAVDAGPDPVVYLEALRRVGVDELDLLVITHGDADHVGGADGLLGRVAVGAIWVPRRDPPAPLVASVIDEARRRGIPVRRPVPGAVLDVGAVHVEVLGPARRYEAENDGSTVLWLTGPERTMFLGGDVETVAQRELPSLRPDVLLVPHHGSATTDPDWLRRTVGAVAVVSVGPNTYGHPSPVVLDVLESEAVRVLTTQHDGDVVVPLG